MEPRIIGVTELQRHCRQVIDEVVDHGRSVVLTRGSRPAAVIVPYGEYVREREAERERAAAEVLSLMERMADRNTGLTEDEAMAIALAEVHAVREERRRYLAGQTPDGRGKST